MSKTQNIALIARATAHPDRLAIVDERGRYSYEELLSAAKRIAANLLQNDGDLCETRVTFMVRPGFEYVAVQWGIWLAGGVAVPHCISHPAPELEYVLTDTQAAIAIAALEFEDVLKPLAEKNGIRFLSSQNVFTVPQRIDLPEISPERRALILYTSGTTSKPKGVVTKHSNIAAQISALISAWGWTSEDYIVNVLPLHHTHGIVNVLCCALWAGATCEFMSFDANKVWDKIASGDLTLFMAVPTIYVRLIAAWEASAEKRRKRLSAGCRNLRLMVSGSAALPVSVFQRWQKITGHTLLERYGMTEIGMALSNPLHGERRPGTVGQPLPGVAVRIVDENGKLIEQEDEQGELQIKGQSVFLEYWQRPEATREAFVDGWFKTGDIMTITDGYYRILGRSSVDIIKTGGYKVSALEIEEVLRTHDQIEECAVVGVPDEQWGESICAAVVLAEGASLNLETLRSWGKERLAHYKVPTRFLAIGELPRNVMGKVTKPAVKKLFSQV